MIKSYRNFIKNDECEELISFFKSNKELILPVLNDNLYHYNGIDILSIFLNDDFKGGELIFDNITVRPQKGQLVYFTGDEVHNVNSVLEGDRYTLVSFLKSDIKITDSKLI